MRDSGDCRARKNPPTFQQRLLIIPLTTQGTSKNSNFRPVTHARIRVVAGGEAARHH